MEILIIIPRYNLTNKADYDYSFPLGLAFISAVLKKEGYNVDCLNLNHLDGKIGDLVKKKLDSKKYGFVMTGNNALGYAVAEIIISASKKHNTHPIVILGGPIITSEPEVIYNALKPDYGVIGEGEETITELLKTLKENKDLKKVKGIIYEENRRLIKTEKREPVTNLDSLPYPDFEGLEFSKHLDNIHSNYVYHGNFFDSPRLYPLLASRSCPFNCTFCYHDSMYRKRSMKSIEKELGMMVKKYRINTILIYDECFALDKERMKEFCKIIKKLQKEISWELKWTCQMRVEPVNNELLMMMKDAGCQAMSYGFESYSPIVLKSMRKNISPEQIDRAMKETIKAKMSVLANFIFGDVAETKETAKETLDYWKKNCLGQVGMGFIQPYPGSEIYKHCLRKGIIKNRLDFIKNTLVSGKGIWLNMTDKMSDKEILQLKKDILDAQSRYMKFVIPSIKKTGKNIYSIKTNCPFCRKEVVYGNCLVKNKYSYGFALTCRDCHLRFFAVSFIQKIGYKYYKIVRSLRDFHLKIRDMLRKKEI